MAYINGKKVLFGGDVYVVDTTVDQTYNPESKNAQSGKAVAQAVNSKADRNKILDYLTYNTTNGSVIITGCNTSISGKHSIPELIEGCPVVHISGAFENCSELIEIIIPKSVRFIDTHSFRGCSKLESVIMLGGVEEIFSGAFERCSNLIEVRLPKSIETIGAGAFMGCGKLSALGNVYYDGTETEWNNLGIIDNDNLLNSTIHYNQELATKEFVLNNSGKAVADKPTLYSGTLFSIDDPSIYKMEYVQGKVPYKAGDFYFNPTDRVLYIFLEVNNAKDENSNSFIIYQGMNYAVSRMYDSESHYAMSGKAVANGISEAVGNIETVLDSIIAIQNELIGG